MYTLKRTRDGCGDSGPGSSLYKRCAISGEIETDFGAPQVGYSVVVGGISHWWQTTLVTEIIEDTKSDFVDGRAIRYVRFKTSNSEYEWTGDIYNDEIHAD